MIDLFSIERACHSNGGVRNFFFFDRSNIASMPLPGDGGIYTGTVSFIDPDKVHHITFTDESSDLTIKSKDSRAGIYFEYTAVGFVPRPRLEVEILINMLKNHRVDLIVTDNNGFQRYCWDMMLMPELNSGKSRGELNGYTMRFSGKSSHAIPTISGEIVTNTSGGNVIFNGGASGGQCATINPIRIGFIPPLTGNTQFKCNFVRASDDSLWYIDHDGRAVSFNTTPADYEITDTDKGPVITSPNGDRWRIHITNYGALESEKL